MTKGSARFFSKSKKSPELPSEIQSSDPPAALSPDHSFHEPGSDESV